MTLVVISSRITGKINCYMCNTQQRAMKDLKCTTQRVKLTQSCAEAVYIIIIIIKLQVYNHTHTADIGHLNVTNHIKLDRQ